MPPKQGPEFGINLVILGMMKPGGTMARLDERPRREGSGEGESMDAVAARGLVVMGADMAGKVAEEVNGLAAAGARRLLTGPTPPDVLVRRPMGAGVTAAGLLNESGNKACCCNC